MLIRSLETGMLGANCYLVICPETRQGALIDPGDEADRIMDLVNQEQVTIVAIINTHGHGDHIGANAGVQKATNAPIICHIEEAPMLTSANQNLSKFFTHPIVSPAAARVVQDGDEIKIGNVTLEVLHTPGHTLGGMCLKGPDVVFSGDTLFAGSVGRTDFPNGSHSTLIQSIREKLLTLPDETIVYPGHGPKSTIEKERTSNPFLIGG
ncbi:MBL fold metallo-hydrolase [Heliorestis acidaminivorans]|uniref:MBL fold metallo-hydrolase n=1 Tax=Heliorestis acidaminivorans TaxID=553427 RepID=A0A6I0EU96_9FIRM|nr:MBL fold metallo-hydrolase [Heliorestis acidaminivorans]KAB2951263.1 MBL fold metallo-hydrolase [Heliorestis acidaminivorans]